MKRRAQIFLLTTLLVLTLIIGISTTLLEIERSKYVDPTPELDQILFAWTNAYDSIVSIVRTQLAVNSQAATLDGTDISANFVTPLANLQQYFLESGYAASITATTAITYNIAGDTTADTTVSITGTFRIYLASGNAKIDQTFNLPVSVRAQNDVNGVMVTETVDNQVNYITKATLSVVSTDNQNGYYSIALAAGTAYTITTVDNILLNTITL